MTPICVCSTTNSRGLELFFKSMELYLPSGVPIYLASPLKPSVSPLPYKWIPNHYGSFGEAYNAIMKEAFLDGHQTVIIANDDIVLDPDQLYQAIGRQGVVEGQGHQGRLFRCQNQHVELAHEREESTARRSMEWHEVAK
jgi:hypothetical protein